MLRLEMLGRFAVTGEKGLIAAPKRRLALFALLDAAGPRGMSRDKILGYLWSESSQENARHSLEQLVYATRRAHGDAVLLGAGDLRLNSDLITSDVREMQLAAASKAFEDVARLYQGPFLDGFFLTQAPELERWIEGERRRLEGLYSRALETLAETAAGNGNHREAVEWRRRHAALDPLSSRATMALMHALSSAGDTPAALTHAQSHQDLLRKELDCEPNAEVAALASALRAGAGKSAASSAGHPVFAAAAPTAQSQLSSAPDLASPAAAPRAPSPTEVVERVTAPRDRLPQHWLRGAVAGAGLLALVALAAFVVQGREVKESSAANLAKTDRSIAVLAFETAGADSAVEYYGYGLTDALIDRLTSNQRLRVIQGPSVYLLRGHRTDTRAIADSLGVANLLASAVVIEGPVVRVSVKLIDGVTGAVRWSHMYRAPWVDRFALQDSIERTVPLELAQQLGTTPQVGRRRGFPKTDRAYELYLKGRHQWNTPTALTVGMRAAVRYFDAALAEDSTYADAYAAKASSYVLLGTGNFSDFRPKAAADSARRAALKAIALDDSLSEAHLALAYIHLLYEFEWKLAEKQFARARDLDPTFARSPLSGVSVYYEWMGRFPEAVDASAKVVSTNPLAPHAVIAYARSLFFAGRLPEASAQIARARALDSTADRLNLTSGEIYLKQGDYRQAMREFERFASLTNQSSRALAFVGHGSAVMGDRRRAQAILTELVKRREAGKGTSFDIAIVYAGLGDNTQAFLWLNRAYDDQSIRPLIRDPTFARLHADPRFEVLLRRMKLRT